MSLEMLYELINSMKKEIYELKLVLMKQNDLVNDMKKLAIMDHLTNVYNRRSFERSLEDYLHDFKKTKYPFTLIYIDLDDFKNVNDTYSHATGDSVLIAIANILLFENRANATVARLGGEEFAIILPGVKEDVGKIVAERIQSKIREHRFVHDIKMTASIGVYSPDENDIMDTVLHKADTAMYYSKESGKNRITLFSDLPEEIKGKEC